MSFSDPLKPKFDNSAETETPRVAVGDLQSRYLSEDGLKEVVVSTQETNKSRKRHSFRMNLSKMTTDPYDTTQNILVGCSSYLVVDRPISGFSNEEVRKLCEGLKAILTEANLKKLIASES
jgi:hypothetical protein